MAVVLEPTRPYELAAVLAEAYRLTPREREVAQHVLLGRSTAEIAAALFLSAWTVQDHLKKVFDKVGVRSRAELASRLFFGDYLPRSDGRHAARCGRLVHRRLITEPGRERLTEAELACRLPPRRRTRRAGSARPSEA